VKIETKYSVGQKLYIVDAEFLPCRVTEIRLAGKNLWYFLEYWTNNECKTVTLGEEDLVSEKPENASGFR
jgi:hypothetical protein